MKIVHVLQGFEADSGISQFVAELCHQQVEAGHECVFVYQCRFEHDLDARVVRVASNGDLSCLGNRPDIVHIHALWSLFSVRAMRWCRDDGIPYVVSPHGCLMPLALRKGWLKKTCFFRFLLRRLMNGAAFVHVTAEHEQTACQALGLSARIEIFPLGTNIPDVQGGAVVKTSRHICFLGRISPEKGLVNLLDAWKNVQAEGWRLVIAGPDWHGHEAELRHKTRVENIKGVCFCGPIRGEAKSRFYHDADVFVLPSVAENFSAVVLDALAYGVPVIATKGTPWRELVEFQCGWWIDYGASPLAVALKEAMALSDGERRHMGSNGRRLAELRYDWTQIAKGITEAYRSVLLTNDE